MRRTRTLAAGLMALSLAGCGENPWGLDESSNGPSMAPGITGTDVIDFEGLPAGTVLSSVTSKNGQGPILMKGKNPHLGSANAAVVFDSANPTGGDCDLGTPNQAFGGPGCGTMVGPGTTYENSTALGKMAIVQTDLIDADGDGLIDVPDDFDLTAAQGVWIFFSFEHIGAQTMQSVTVVDTDGNGPDPRVVMFAADTTIIGTVPIPNDMPDNGKAVVDLGGTPNVMFVRVVLNGSGAVDDLTFGEAQPELGEVGDYVWCDINDDGVQDAGEPGIPGVRVDMDCVADDGSTLSVSTTTDSDGLYLFTGVPAGSCVVTVDPSTAPDDKVPGTHCPTSHTVDLGEGESYLDADFCFITVDDPSGEGCTPGYWKNHLDSWDDTSYSPDDTVESVFSSASAYSGIGSATLLEALSFKGGSDVLGAARILVHHAVAAVLNASHGGTDYPRSEGDIILDVNSALDSGDRGTMLGLKDGLDADNNLGCPLN